MTAALAQAWPPFVLVAALVLIGEVAARDGVFDALAAALERVGGGGVALLVASLALTAAVSTVLNLDTAVVFCTPILVLAARRRGLDERPFLYGALLMSNAGSLLLPGSNLTNLLVLAHDPVGGGRFAARLAPAAVTAALVTGGGLLAWWWRALHAAGPRAVVAAGAAASPRGRLRGVAGPLAAVTAAALVALLAHPALPVAGLAVLAAAVVGAQGRLTVREAVAAVGPAVLVALFLAAVALGVLARTWALPGRLTHSAGVLATAALAAVAAVVVNNLPAAVLLSSGPVAHPRALLLGLNLGPNLALTGSLSAYLWWRSARSVDTVPSAREVSRQGVVLAPLAIGAALAATALLAPGRL